MRLKFFFNSTFFYNIIKYPHIDKSNRFMFKCNYERPPFKYVTMQVLCIQEEKRIAIMLEIIQKENSKCTQLIF